MKQLVLIYEDKCPICKQVWDLLSAQNYKIPVVKQTTKEAEGLFKTDRVPLLLGVDSGKVVGTIKNFDNLALARISALAAKVLNEKTSFIRSIYNLFSFLSNMPIYWLKTRNLFVNDSYLNHRRHLCSICPMNSEGKCQACGCVIAIKTKWAAESCPKGLWFKMD